MKTNTNIKKRENKMPTKKHFFIQAINLDTMCEDSVGFAYSKKEAEKIMTDLEADSNYTSLEIVEKDI